ncbi:MAG: hypothetical protein ACK5HY_00805 [Parahaliea sp.]
MTPTGEMGDKPVSALEVFAVIGGKKVYLPAEARYVMQDYRGLWFYSTRKPRTAEGDWTPNKTSICCRTEGGYVRVLRTDPQVPWLDTCQRTIRIVTGKEGRRPADED